MARERAQQRVAVRALVVELAGISRHGLAPRVSALRTSDGSFELKTGHMSGCLEVVALSRIAVPS
jgi:hypothetical protein